MRRLPIVLALALAAPGSPSAKPRGRLVQASHRASAQHATPPARRPSAASPLVERLGRGARLFESGDYAGAAKELAPLESAPLRNRDLVLHLLAESEALAGDRERALGHFRALGALSSRRAVVARARAADLAWDLGRRDEARAGYEAVLKTPSPAVEPAVARFRLAESFASTDSGRAAALYRKVWLGAPLHPLAERAWERLRTLDPSAAPTPAERVERAKLLTAARAWQRALDELALIPADAPSVVRDEADYWIGTNHFRMRHGYDVAAEKLLAVAPRLAGDRQTEALFHGARAWSRADQDDRAIAGYRDLVRRFPHARQAPEAQFLIGWLEYNRGRYTDALPGLEETLRRYGGSTFADDARWYLGFSRWMLGDTAGALADFDQLARKSAALVGGKGRYWRGRALEKLGRHDEAMAAWRDCAAEYPFSYYGLQSRARLADHGVTVGAFGGSASARAQVSAIGPVDESLAAEPGIARADELLAAGLPRYAAEELDDADGPLLSRYGARAVPLLLDRFRKAEDFFGAHRLAESWGSAALRVDPHAVPAAATWWKHVYPLAWRAHVERYAPTGNNPTYYLYTIMQKESAYNPHDVSYADAIGLLQMIPPTSRRVAAKIDRPYTDDVLYDPEGNIQFGAWYIGHLLAKFKGQIPIGAGSYNAGPGAMMKWLKKSGDRPLDEFIELCSYTQTREYMKKVLDIYSRYLYLYEQKDYLPSPRVDTAWLDDGIDY